MSGRREITVLNESKYVFSLVIGVRRFNKTSSIYNTPVERHWHDVNLVTFKYKEEFRLLETLGAFEKHDPVDVFVSNPSISNQLKQTSIVIIKR